jgi:hypothetical protein
MNLKKIQLSLMSILLYSSTFSQFESLKGSILKADSFNIDQPREKIFIHYDKPYYTINDTLWLKGYIVSAKDCSALDSSGIAYIEIRRLSGELMKRVSTYCAAGIFYSNIRLTEEDFKQGLYLLKAYTKHMQGSGDSLFFESQFKIINPFNSEWRWSGFDAKIVNNKFRLSGAITPISNKKIDLQKVSFVLRSGNRTLFKKDFLTDKNGNISIDTLVNTELHGNAAELEISDDKPGKIIFTIPVIREPEIDVQFLPEGGTFITNKRQRLGFKAIDILGNSIEVMGRIENSKKQVVTRFSSVHNGMGTIWLTPERNEKYVAILDNGLSCKIPEALPSGVQLQVNSNPGSDSVDIMVDASPDLYGNQYFLRASAKGISFAMGTIKLKEEPYHLHIAKKAFPSGISRFTLYDSSLRPINERVVFLWLHDDLTLEMLAHRPAYTNRDSVHILLTAKNRNNDPVVGSFSIVVIDTGKVHYSKYSANIISYLLLESELNGRIEDPSYYFDNPVPDAIESLLLTQGWVQYNPPSSTPVFEYEKGFTLKGKVVNLFNKTVNDADITLLGKDGKANTFVLNTTTDKSGKFALQSFPTFLTDTVTMLLRARNKKSKTFGLGINLDNPIFPSPSMRSHYMNFSIIHNDSISARYLREQVKITYKEKEGKGYLPEVIVNAKLKIKGSKNLNMDGGSDQTISAKTLETMPKLTLLDVLIKKVKGLHIGPLSKSPLQVYKRDGDLVVFIIDGYNINETYDPISDRPTAFTDYLDAYLKYITAEEVAGIEIMTTSKNTIAYEKYYNLTPGLISYSFIEITTYSGNGAFSKKIPGMYLCKPLAPTIAKTFYSPRYSTNESSTGILDYRSTIFWKPDIITNENGKAEISFFTSDSPNGYLIIAQGTDMKGGLGVSYLFLPKEQGLTADSTGNQNRFQFPNK